MRRHHRRLNEVESDADDSKVAHEVDQMKVKIASTSLGQCLEGILTNADVKGVTVELLNKVPRRFASGCGSRLDSASL